MKYLLIILIQLSHVRGKKKSIMLKDRFKKLMYKFQVQCSHKTNKNVFLENCSHSEVGKMFPFKARIP